MSAVETDWLIRGDGLALPHDGSVPTANILGRVVRIERQDRRVRLGLGVERYGITLLARLGLLFPGLRLAALLNRALRRQEPVKK